MDHSTTRRSSPPEGTTNETLKFSQAIFMAIAAFTAVAWYNVIELNVQVFLTFKRHRGLYFWSLLISSYGCILHALGFLIKFFLIPKKGGQAITYLAVSIITVGWYAMVTGQAVVLYSRLHLVVREQRILRAILVMIIFDAICFHIPTTILTYGSNSEQSHKYEHAFNVVERLQMTVFCVQEFIISGVYVWSTVRLLRPVYHGRTRKVMMQLVWINLIIIGMDAVLLVMEYGKYYEIEATLKAMVYSIKLKLEFAVLNQLMTLANSSVNSAQQLHVHETEGHPDGGKEMMRPNNEASRPPNKQRSSGYPASARSSRPASTFSQYAKQQNGGRMKWIPSLDRNCVVSTEPAGSKDTVNVFTNPAAVYQASKSRPPGFPPHDGLGGIPPPPEALEADEDSEKTEIDASSPSAPPSPPHATFAQDHAPLPSINDPSNLAPDDGPPQSQHAEKKKPHSRAPSKSRLPVISALSSKSHSRTPSASSRFRNPLHSHHPPSSSSQQPGRRAHPPPAFDFNPPEVMPNGLLRSSRPSVADWAHGPDSGSQAESEEEDLDPYDMEKFGDSDNEGERGRRGGRKPGASGEMEFVTSALT